VDALATIDAKYKGNGPEDNEFLNNIGKHYLDEAQFPLTHPLADNPRFISEEF
jgi:hypothetical protein